MSGRRLNREILPQRDPHGPVTVLQIGEGNFLRGFADWMLHVSLEKGLFRGSVAVTQPRPSGKPKIEALAVQDGMYTLVERGIECGRQIERRTVVDIFSQVFDPYGDWDKFLKLSECETLRFVISNTTEAGISYKPEPLTTEAIQSFPGKMANLLYLRFLSFGGEEDKGLIFLPCELVENNGDVLRENIVRYSKDWGYPDVFRAWLETSNRFLNTLVDRIVTGYPDDPQAQTWFADWGYTDLQLTTAEPYHLWAIEGEEALDELLPLRKAGLNVIWTDNLTPYQQRKVRILNAAHTWMAPIGLLNGVEHVRQFLEHPELGAALKATIRQEIVPTLPYPDEDMLAYADTVFERFANPFIRHRLSDIAMNSLSKFKVRLLPSLQYYLELGLALPANLIAGLAGLLRYYRVSPVNEGYAGRDYQGNGYVVRDDAEHLKRIAEVWGHAERTGQPLKDTLKKLLAQTAIWGTDLSTRETFIDALAECWGKNGGDQQ